MNKAIFFDRDGVLNVDSNLVTGISEIKFYDNVPAVISCLRNLGYKIFIVTNQPAVARGLITEKELEQINIQYKDYLLSKNPNAIIDKISYCPHHPKASIDDYRIKCDCRKPRPGMILELAKEFNINLKKSYMIGDRVSDIIAGHLAGCKTVLVLGENINLPPIESNIENYQELIKIKADYEIKNLEELEAIVK